MSVKTKVFLNTFREGKSDRGAGTPFTAQVLVTTAAGQMVEHRHFAGEGEATKWARARKRELTKVGS